MTLGAQSLDNGKKPAFLGWYTGISNFTFMKPKLTEVILHNPQFHNGENVKFAR
jgi:hypothetical protein